MTESISSLFFRNEEELLYGKDAINIHIKLTRVKYYLEEWYVSKKMMFFKSSFFINVSTQIMWFA